MDSSKLITSYLNKMTRIQNTLLGMINIERGKEIDFQNIIFFLDELKICTKRNEFKSLLHLLSILYENHHQRPENMMLIEKIITNYKDYILKNFQNCEIYSIFNNDNKLLLYLIQTQILKIDANIIHQLNNNNQRYFYQEVKDSLESDIEKEISKEIPDDFIIKRKKGENDSYLCEIIRNDSIDEFISYVAKTNISLNYEIKQSIFETNSYLINKNITLIEYAAFYGSMQIFKYLQLNKAKLPNSLWLYAIHGQNTEIISILEDKNIKPDSFKKCYKEAIKCHFNDMANYIQENYLQENNDNDNTISPLIYFKYYNFEFIKPEQINKSIFHKLCRYDYILFVDVLMKTEDIDINSLTIHESTYNENDFITMDSTALFEAINLNNTEIANILLENDDIDVNYKYSTSIVISLKNKIKELLSLLSVSIIPLFLLIFSHIFLSQEKLKKIDTKWYISLSILGVVSLISQLVYIISESLQINSSIRLLQYIKAISLKSLKFHIETITALHLACINNNTEIVKALLKKKNIDVNAKFIHVQNEIEESNALNFAINNEEIVKSLILHPNIDINIKYKLGTLIGIDDGTLNSIKFLIILKLIECKVLWILLAVMFIICLLILFYYAPPARKKKVLLFSLCILVCAVIIHYIPYNIILEKIRRNKDTLVIIRNYLSNIIKTIKLGMPLIFCIFVPQPFLSLFYCNYIEMTALINAIENDHTETAKILLSNKNIDVNSTYKYHYSEKEVKNNNQISSKVDNFLNIYYYKDIYMIKTALNVAAEKNNTEIVKVLLLNPNTNIEDTSKTSYIRRSSTNKSIESWILYLFESLVYYFVPMSKKTSLNIAVENTNIDVVKQLLEKSTINSVKNDFEKILKENAKEVPPIEEEEEEKEEKENDLKESSAKKDEILKLIQNFINENHTH